MHHNPCRHHLNVKNITSDLKTARVELRENSTRVSETGLLPEQMFDHHLIELLVIAIGDQRLRGGIVESANFFH